MLNLGCGERAHPDWINIDFSWRAALRRVPVLGSLVRGAPLPNYRNHDLRKGIPYSDGTVEVTYASHVLEHLWPEDARSFLLEMKRVLRPGGTIRLVVPDLESITREYLAALETVRSAGAGNADASLRYEWSVIWLLDQLVRRRPGGQMVEWLGKHRDSNFVRGMEGIFQELATVESSRPRGGIAGLLNRVARNRDPASTGELHRWMYDSHSLRQLLGELGFSDIRNAGPFESRIAGWPALNLDGNPDGTPHQPGSIWMEATR